MDIAFGDPRSVPHIVCAIGALITNFEKFIRKLLPKSPVCEKFGGIVLVLTVLFVSGVVPFVLLKAAESVSVGLRFCLESLMCWQCLAAKSLKEESVKVYFSLKNGGVLNGRKAVSMIVGRDVSKLSFNGVIRATVETVAENTSDGFVAPAIFMAMGGGVGGILYKAANTMDSMVGYKNEKYINFGWAAARTDDVLNFIPARVSAVFMILSSAILGYDWRNAVAIFRRDRLKHSSPNSANTEAVCAGALGIRLAGDAWYFGKLYKKEFIGDPCREIEVYDIVRACRIMYTTAFLLIAFLFLAGVIFCCISTEEIFMAMRM